LEAKNSNGHLKAIPPTSLPQFNDKINKDLDTFLFEFEIVRKSDHIKDEQKLKLFPTAHKYLTMCWFMSLSIKSWDQMKKAFLHKYREYYQIVNPKEEIL
jgi:hypothetical protein